MPELPEVETIVRGLRARLPGRRIQEVAVTQPSILRTPAARFVRALEGAEVREVSRFGKHIVMRMQAVRSRRAARGSPLSFFWIVHLGMTGQLIVSPSAQPALPHTHAWFELDREESLRYIDIRRFGRMEITEPSAQPVLPARMERHGPEPLEISEQEFIERLRSRKARLKALLLDQRFLRGVGNIYADESLFRAGLHPAALASRLSPARAGRLWHAVREVLQEAIAHGGSSISDYVDASGQAGWFQESHRVYGRGGEPCLCCGARLRRAIVAGRGTAWCPRCQRLNH